MRHTLRITKHTNRHSIYPTTHRSSKNISAESLHIWKHTGQILCACMLAVVSNFSSQTKNSLTEKNSDAQLLTTLKRQSYLYDCECYRSNFKTIQLFSIRSILHFTTVSCDWTPELFHACHASQWVTVSLPANECHVRIQQHLGSSAL